MTEKELLERLDTLAREFEVPLRMGDGLSQEKFVELYECIKECEETWKDSDVIPKLAANIFVDMFNAVMACASLYDEEERKKIFHAADKLQDAIRGTVQV